MSDSANGSAVRRLYQARGNLEVIRQAPGLSDVRWKVVDGFPYGAVYVGLESVIFGAFYSTLTNSSRTAPSFSSRANASSTALETQTHQENRPARAFYERHGFVAVKYVISPPPESAPDVEYHWRPQPRGSRAGSSFGEIRGLPCVSSRTFIPD